MRRTLLTFACTVLALLTVASAPASAAPGDVVCEKFGSTPVADGRYEVQNNVWGSDEPQCVRAFDVGFEVTEGAHHNSSMPAAYPSIFAGCHYGTCTAGTVLPRAVQDLGPVTSTFAIQAPEDGTWVAAYDIWFDPTPRRNDTVTGLELMIWLRTTGPAPIGERTGTATVDGAEWEVWEGENGADVLSYVRVEPIDRVDDLDLMAFAKDATARGKLPPEWYMTSVQAGFEPWVGGKGLTTTEFAVTGIGADPPVLAGATPPAPVLTPVPVPAPAAVR
ncbi:Glycosyl hydrolase family 12 [Pseudonocardia thermophila]|uniref:Glycosyl hydrolase family 12 n=1 Tax=Pseudonocardia thermophila TaxID=1848 RepID=A0A1M6U341_PSETH|nr:hypothetical protein [Pseudonocardia thermophila]SHK63702.1 Glycosyl hydrolase family 12 [Pseudonocardia thermophila]